MLDRTTTQRGTTEQVKEAVHTLWNVGMNVIPNRVTDTLKKCTVKSARETKTMPNDRGPWPEAEARIPNPIYMLERRGLIDVIVYTPSAEVHIANVGFHSTITTKDMATSQQESFRISHSQAAIILHLFYDSSALSREVKHDLTRQVEYLFFNTPNHLRPIPL